MSQFPVGMEKECEALDYFSRGTGKRISSKTAKTYAASQPVFMRYKLL
jgi:hypothetical protein